MSEKRKHRRTALRTLCILIIVAIVLCLCYQFAIHLMKTLYPMRYQDEVIKASSDYGFPPSLIYAIIHTESKFDKNALSPAKAKGLMQITDDTFRWAQRRTNEERIDSDNLYIPGINIKYGCLILSLLSEQFSDLETVLAAYNAGQGHVNEWLKDTRYSSDGVALHTIPYEETAHYVSRVLTAQKCYQRLYNIP